MRFLKFLMAIGHVQVTEICMLKSRFHRHILAIDRESAIITKLSIEQEILREEA